MFVPEGFGWEERMARGVQAEATGYGYLEIRADSGAEQIPLLEGRQPGSTVWCPHQHESCHRPADQ